MKTMIKTMITGLMICSLLICAACSEGLDFSYHQKVNEIIPAILVQKKDLVVSVNEETLALNITDNASGYIWRSDDLPDKSDLSYDYEMLAMNGISIGYFNSRNISIEKGFSDFDSVTSFDYSSEGIDINIRLKDIGVNLKMNICYTDDGVSVSIPYSSVTEEKEAFRLHYIILYPFLGSSLGNADGYMFVPDGSGAIIDLSVKTRAQQPYSKRIYGEDLSVNINSGSQLTDLLTDIAMPVFGIGYGGKNAYLAYIKKGAEYAELNAYAASITTDYNFCYARYIYRDSYYQLLNKQGDGHTAVQKDKNIFDIEQKIMFLSGDNSSYSGMAERYRTELVNEQTLKANISETEHTPIKIDFLMADRKKSLLGHSTVKMSTAGFVKETLHDILPGKTVNSTLKGYGKGGTFDLGGYSYDSKTGSNKQYKDLFNFCDENGIKMHLEMNLVRAESGSVGKSNLAKTLSDQIIIVSDTKMLYWYLDEFYELNLAAIPATQEFFNNQLKELSKSRVRGIEYQNLGNLLSSSFGNNYHSRTDAINTYNLILDNSLDSAISRPNQYVWKNINTATEIPLSSSGYLIFTEDVPFMQILLSGSVQMYGNYLNLGSNDSDSLLRLIEFGVSPSYLLTEENPIDLMNTRSNFIFCSSYGTLKEDINTSYGFISGALDAVKGTRLTAHCKIEKGIYKSSYSNGKAIIVNYNNAETEYKNAVVPAKGFLVINE